MRVELDNSQGLFNDENDTSSIWSGFLTHYKTLVKAEFGYTADDGTEYGQTYSAIVTDNIQLTAKNTAVMPCRPLISILKDLNADKIGNPGGAYTASELVEQVRDVDDSNSIPFFTEVMPTALWSIEATTNTYTNLTASSQLEDIDCLEFVRQLGEAENRVTFSKLDGTLTWNQNIQNTTAAVYEFYGAGFHSSEYGHNIQSVDNMVRAVDKVYNRVRVKYEEPDTSTSYHTEEQTFTIGDKSSSDIYGVRTYEFENEWIPDATVAEDLAQAIQTEYLNPKREFTLNAKFVPHLDALDRVKVWYDPAWARDIEEDDGIWDVSEWDTNAEWVGESGDPYEFYGVDFFIMSQTINLDRFTTQFKLREIG